MTSKVDARALDCNASVDLAESAAILLISLYAGNMVELSLHWREILISRTVMRRHVIMMSDRQIR